MADTVGQFQCFHSEDWKQPVESMPFLRTFALLIVFAVGCQTPDQCCYRGHVNEALLTRTGAGLGPVLAAEETAIPPHVTFEDGLTDDEAVAVALWNNAAYQELLVQLGLTNARLFDAGLLTDPQFTVLFPLGPKQLEFFGFQSIDALWLRPIRQRAAELDACRVADQMLQNGLDVIRDVRIGHADLVLAQRRAALTVEIQQIRQEIADLADSRLQAGDISELEATAVRIDALRARVDANQAAQDVTLAAERLRWLTGMGISVANVTATETPALDPPELSEDELLHHALAMRPDLRATEIAFQASTELADLARNQFMTLEAIYDANGQGLRGFESGPGVRFTLPIFNGNRGNIAIADVAVVQATRQYVTVRDRIAFEVRTAQTQAQQAAENLQIVRDEILPALETAVSLSRKHYEGGGTSYFLVLQTMGQYLDARTRELELTAALRRAIAELERSVGYRLTANIETATNESDDMSEIPPAPAAEGFAAPE